MFCVSFGPTPVDSLNRNSTEIQETGKYCSNHTRYWDDFQTKWGFGDGNSIPDGAGIYRDVYLKVVNELARRNGSRHRYVPFNRPGVHNYYLVILVPGQWFEEVYLPSQAGQEIWQAADDDVLNQYEVPEKERDTAMRDAVAKASELYLDQYLDVTVSVAPEFKEFLAGPMLTEDEEGMDDEEEEPEEQN